MHRAAVVFTLLWFVLVPTPANPPQKIAYGQTAQGELNSLQAERLYTFEGRGGDVITVTMDRVDGVIDPLVMLIDSSLQNVLAVDNDGGGDRNARLRFVIPGDGTYVIKATAVQGGDLNGSYRLALVLGNPTPTPSPQKALPRLAPLNPGDSPQAELSQAVQFRLYALRLLKGGSISAALKTVPELQAGLYLFDADFRELGRAELGSTLNFTAPADGLYLLMAARTSGEGAYTLSATIPTPAPLPLQGTPLVPGQAQPGTFGEQIGTLYTFDAQPGTSVDLLLESGDAVLILADSAMNELAESSTGQIRGVALPGQGRYATFVIYPAGPNGKAEGEYGLTLHGTINPTATPELKANSAPQITEISYGIIANDTITDSHPALYYSFRGTAGDSVSILMNHISGNGLDPLLYLYDYSGGTPKLIAGNDSRAPGDTDAAISDVTLPANGTYLIVATRSGNTVGSFILSLNHHG